jgi:hypothetical protein
MRGMRQRLKKWQWFVLFNLVVLAGLYLKGSLRFTVQDILSVILGLGLVNLASLISAAKFKDWKK